MASNARLYFTWSHLAATGDEAMWMPVCILRHDEIEELQGKQPALIAHVLRQLLPMFAGFAISHGEETNYVVTGKIYMIADEAAIRASIACKGSAGLRCCFKCRNVVASHLPEMTGFATIWEHNPSKFDLQTDKGVADILDYLRVFRGSKARRDEAEILGRMPIRRCIYVIYFLKLCTSTHQNTCVHEAGHPLSCSTCVHNILS